FAPKTRVNLITQQRDRFAVDEIQAWHFNPLLSEPEQQAVLLGHTIKAPAVIPGLAVQGADLPHPLAAPRRGIKKRHHAKRPGSGMVQCLPYRTPIYQLRLHGLVCVEKKVHAIEQFKLVPISGAPFDEITALVFAEEILLAVFSAPVA